MRRILEYLRLWLLEKLLSPEQSALLMEVNGIEEWLDKFDDPTGLRVYVGDFGIYRINISR